MRLILLPGMDGTGALFEPLLRVLPREILPAVVSYPTQTSSSIDALLSIIEGRLPRAEPFVLLAESFSGPLALKLAARPLSGLQGLVLVATFIRNPGPALFAKVSWAAGLFAALPLSDRVLRQLLVGEDAPAELVSTVAAAIRSVRPAVRAARLRQVFSVDVSEDARRCPVPMLYLRGTADRLVSVAAEAALRAVKPELMTVSLDAPHLLLQRRPTEAAEAIRRFVHEIDARGGSPPF